MYSLCCLATNALKIKKAPKIAACRFAVSQQHEMGDRVIKRLTTINIKVNLQ